VEVWSGPVLVGTLSGAALCLIVEHYLSMVTVTATVTAELARPCLPPVLPARRKPPVPVIDKPALRAARRSRKPR
jgi:hypothetical protein